jgi:hypothetical protein
MAGINNLVKGAVGSFAKDKVSQYLSPAQADFITFALNPQAYLLDKGVNAAANALGYGSQYRELKGGAQGENEYYKEVMRDSIGDMLPDTVGDFVRATPRNTETDNTPAGVYYDPNVGDFVQSSNPVASSDPFAGDRFGGKYDQDSVFNTNSQNYVGPANPKDMDSSIYSSNLTDLLSMLDEYRAAEVPEMVTTESKTDGGGGNDLSYTEMLDILNSTPSISASRGLNVPVTESLASVGSIYDPNLGMNVPVTESVAPEGYMFDAGSGMNVPVTESLAPEGYMFDANTGMNEYLGGDSNYYGDFDTSMNFGGGGGGGGKYYDDFSSQAYAKGGRVRGCNC